MVEQDGTRPRRRRRSSEVDDQLAELLAKRDTLDADKAERDRIEKEALRRYAEAQVQLAGIDSETRRRVDELQQQIADVQQKARDDRAAGEQVQAEALAALNGDPVGRKAEELAQLFDLPIKRVRRMIREGKPGKAPGSAASSVSSPRPTKDAPHGSAARSDAGTTALSNPAPTAAARTVAPPSPATDGATSA
ncbi:hypothetical protein HFP15_39915 [Amycolatopsis sp. K13G38]|uniref:Uncharacterized protein n=1 Tax=Amycolatopsis acididurans TaxID=2724524 RepID=A0ABX1JGW2_9PSEU|nr:hypothetical protein [Amycolatopsis acididurans]NKQ59027.1 hypothetical protein [Amycolatopsis acididurans]